MKSFEISAMGLESMCESEMRGTNGGCILKFITFLREAYREWREDTFGK